jgi:hypothetical protein
MKTTIKFVFPLFLLAFLSSTAFSLETNPVIKGVYIVQKGDCLWTIAAKTKIFGDPWQWPLFLEYNKALLSNPNKIEIGVMLAIPSQISPAQIHNAISYARKFPGPHEKHITTVPAFNPVKMPAAIAKPEAAAPVKAAQAAPAAKAVEESKPEASTGAGAKVVVLIVGFILIAFALVSLGRQYRTRASVPVVAAPPVQMAQPAPEVAKAPEAAPPVTEVALPAPVAEAPVAPPAAPVVPEIETSQAVAWKPVISPMPQPETPAPQSTEPETPEQADKKHQDAA